MALVIPEFSSTLGLTRGRRLWLVTNITRVEREEVRDTSFETMVRYSSTWHYNFIMVRRRSIQRTCDAIQIANVKWLHVS